MSAWFVASVSLVLAASAQDVGPPPDAQARIDREAAAMAARVRLNPAGRGEPARDRGPAPDPRRRPWRPVTDALVNANTGLPVIPGYRHHLSATADLDRDGRPDQVSFVDNGTQGAIRIAYGDSRKPVRIVQRGDRWITGQGLFAAGPNAVMVNQPEVNAFLLFERAGRVMLRFMGD